MKAETYSSLDSKQSNVRRQRRWRRTLDVLTNYAFIAPYLILFFVFSIGPTLYGFYISFFDWQILGTHTFIGVANFRKLMGDELFRIAFINTLYFTALTVGIETGVALLTALVLRHNFRGRDFFQFIFYGPVTLSAAVMGVLMTQLLTAGTLNYYLSFVGLGNLNFLANVHTVIPSISLVSVWWGFGFPVLIFLAGLYSIPANLYEAAQIDGAGVWQSFLRITLPLLRPTLLFVLVTTAIAHFQVFAQMYIMTSGGPGYSSLSIVMYLFQNAWQYYDMGYASTVAVVLALSMTVTTGILFKLIGSRFEF